MTEAVEPRPRSYDQVELALSNLRQLSLTDRECRICLEWLAGYEPDTLMAALNSTAVRRKIIEELRLVQAPPMP